MEQEALIDQYHNLIYKLALKYSRFSPFEDLYQAGAIGLIIANRKFDPSHGVKFITYAYSFIKGEMYRLVCKDKTLNVSTELIQLKAKINEVSEKLTNKMGRVPSTTELSEFLDVEESKLILAMNANNHPVSLDASTNNHEEDINLYEVIGDDSATINDDYIALNQSLERLTEEERLVIEEKYYQGRTQSEIAKNLGINQVAVSRKEQRVLRKLKLAMQ